MSHIEGMAILGIRSFDPDEPSYIKFYSPLTLIVGENGCGKTTIIESLKYACTGELPPNSKGGAFVNDPRLSGQTEVKGQIKLKFSNVNGERMVCTRSLAVSLKKNAVSQKAIDNSLLRYDNNSGEAYSISSRCADMDAELPVHLGVPKAILDNVVFCHQEDSNWPFSEPSVLKKKFDDIFSSKRYAVALDNIKEIIKEKKQEVQIGNVRLEALKADAVKAKKIRETLTQLNQQMNTKTETLATIESKIQQIGQNVIKLNDVFRDIDLTADQIQQIINKKDFYTSTMISLESHITPRTESTYELKKMLNDLNVNSNLVEQEKANILTEKTKLERRLKKIQDELSQKHLIMGRLEAAMEEHQRQIQARAELIEKTNQEHKMQLPVQDGKQTVTLLKKKLHLLSLTSGKHKEAATTKQNALSDELQLLKSRLLSIQENKKHLLSRIEQDKIQIDIIEKKIQGFQVSDSEVDSTQEKIKENEEKLAKLDANSSTKGQEELSKKERELREYDEEINDLNDELARLGKEGDIRAKLSLKRSEKESKEKDVAKLYNGFIRDVEALIQSKPSIENVERDLTAYRNEKQEKLKALIEKRNTANRALSAAEAQLNMVQQNLNAKKKEYATLSKIVNDVSKGKNVPEEIAKVEKTVDDVKQALGSIEGAKYIYGQFLKGVKESECCPLCSRGYDDAAELKELEEKIEGKNTALPEKYVQLKEKLAKFTEHLGKLKAVQGPWMRLENVKKDIASIQQTVDKYKSDKENAASKADVATAEQVEVDKCKIKADGLLNTAGNISRILKETKVVQDEIESIESELQFSGSTRTISDCQKDLEELADKTKLVRRDMKRINSDIDTSRRQASAIEHQIRDYREKLLGLQHKQDFRVGLNMQLEEMKEQLAEHQNECKNIEKDVDPLKQKVQETQQEYEEAVTQWRVKEEAASNEERVMSRIVERLEEFNNDTSRIEAATSSNRVGQVKSEISELENSIKNTSQQITGADERLAVIEKDEAERRGTERDLQDQLRYRQTEVDLKNCEADLKELEEKQGEYDANSLRRELRKAQQEEANLVDKRGSLRGELGQMKDQIKRYEDELTSDYDNVDGRYGRLFIEVKTNELSSSDLEKYSKVLQTAIMKYHSLKMEDLNKIIKELWLTTYRGGDIDYIAIRADNEGTAVNRSFNYRVVMCQNGNELNMRGRCSAGQKVLASIIIRLALAETFGVNCGIFTLDEPTTNLDQANIESLAHALKTIIENRRQQANFQFVIITHDEKFVDYMGGSDIFSKYYRISKEDGVHSTIRQQGEGTAAPLAE